MLIVLEADAMVVAAVLAAVSFVLGIVAGRASVADERPHRRD